MTNVQDMDDLQLVRLIQQSDRQAFSVFYDRYVNLIFSIAYNILGDQNLAEEVTQDVFLKIWYKIDRYNPTLSKVNTWMSRIARNRTIDVLRKNKHINQQVRWAEAEPRENPDAATTEEQAEQRMTNMRVRSALAQLPEEQRAVLALAYFKGMSQREIAEELGEPLGTVKTRVRLGMQKLRGLLIDEH